MPQTIDCVCVQVFLCVFVCLPCQFGDVNRQQETEKDRDRETATGRETPNETKRTVTPLLAVPINSAFRQYFVIFVAFFLCKKQKYTKNLLTSLTLHTDTQEKQLSPRAQMTVGVHKTCH